MYSMNEQMNVRQSGSLKEQIVRLMSNIQHKQMVNNTSRPLCSQMATINHLLSRYVLLDSRSSTLTNYSDALDMEAQLSNMSPTEVKQILLQIVAENVRS